MILHAWERIAECCYRCTNCQWTVATLRDRAPPRRFGGGCEQLVKSPPRVANTSSEVEHEVRSD